MSNHSPGTSYTDLQGSSLRMSNQTMNLYKALDRLQCPLASHGDTWGEGVRDPGLRWLTHCTCMYMWFQPLFLFLFCLLKNSWKFLMTLFPVQLGLILYVFILLSPKPLQTGQFSGGGGRGGGRHPTKAIKRDGRFTAIIWALSHVYF